MGRPTIDGKTGERNVSQAIYLSSVLGLAIVGEVTSSPATFDELDICQHHLTIPRTTAHHSRPDAYPILTDHQCSTPGQAHLRQLLGPGLMNQNTYTCTVINYKGE